MRRLLHVAMTRARKGLVLAWAEGAQPGATPRPSPFYEEALAALDVEEEEFEEELFGPAEGLHSTFRIMRDELLDTVARVGGRLGEMRLDTYLDVDQAVSRYLELIKVAALIERAQGGPVARRGAHRGQRDPRPVRDRRAARDPRAVRARRLAARHRARPRQPPRRARQRLGALARPVHPASRPRPDAVRERHRHLPDLPAQVQVRARLPDPAGADHPPALRDRRAPGPGALPHPGRRLAGAADGAVRGVLAALRLRRHGRRAAVPRARGGGARALLGRGPPLGGRAGLVRALIRVPARAAPAARARRPRRPASGRHLRADRLQDRQVEDRGRTCARTSSSRSTRWARASPGGSRPPRRATSTC